MCYLGEVHHWAILVSACDRPILGRCNDFKSDKHNSRNSFGSEVGKIDEVRRDNLLSCLVEAQGGFCSCVVFVAAISFAEAHLAI